MRCILIPSKSFQYWLGYLHCYSITAARRNHLLTDSMMNKKNINRSLLCKKKQNKTKQMHSENDFQINYTRDIWDKTFYSCGYRMCDFFSSLALAAEASLLLTVVCFFYLVIRTIFHEDTPVKHNNKTATITK